MRRATVNKRLFLLTFLLGFVWTCVMSPLAIPDEEYHYRVSWCLSNILLGHADAPTQGDARYFDFSGLRGHYNVSTGYARLFGEILTQQSEGQNITVLPELPRVYLPMYLPQTLGLALGRALGLGFGGCFLLGRLGNLAFFALFLALAAGLAPEHKTALTAAGLLPMALHQAASFSYDPFLNGMALVFFAALLRCRFGKGILSKREYRSLLGSAALLAPAKGACLPLLFLIWRIPQERFVSPTDRKHKLWGLMALCLGSLAFFFLPTVSRQLGGALNWEGEYNYSPVWALAHPLAMVDIFIRTIRREGLTWFRCMAGYSLAGLTLPLSWWIPLVLLGTLPLAGTPEGEEVLPGDRIALAAAGMGMVVLSMLVMLFTWTSDTRDVIQGVQGRYFLPAAAPMALVLSPPKKVPYRDGVVLSILLVCHTVSIIEVLQYTFA